MRSKLSAGGRRRPRLAAFAFAAAVAGAPLVAAAAPEATPAQDPAGSSPELSEAQLKQAARAQVQAGSAAFGVGDFALAIEHYEAAIALLPAPKLHYNLGVCHQRLSLSADSPEQRTRQRDLAIESYNAYLAQNPRAEDRLEVAATIRELGGTPVTMPTLKPVFEDTEDLPRPAPDTDAPVPDPAATAEPPPRPAKIYPRHGRIGVALAGGYSPTMNAAATIDARSMIALDLHGGGFLGPKRGFFLAAHTSFYSGATLRPRGLALAGYSLGLLGEQTWVVGREGLMIGLGGVVALAGQSLDVRGGDAPPVCRIGDDVRVAARTGAHLAPRLDLGILLGPPRRGMIGVMVQPGFGIFADGRSGTGCEPGETPWTTHGVRQRWQFQLWLGAGYSLRF